MKKSIVILSMLMLVFCLPASASMKGSMKSQGEAKICPVSGQAIKGEGVSAEYNGKTYKLCCGMCKKDFLKDPESYIEKVEEMEDDHSGHDH